MKDGVLTCVRPPHPGGVATLDRKPLPGLESRLVWNYLVWVYDRTSFVCLTDKRQEKKEAQGQGRGQAYP